VLAAIVRERRRADSERAASLLRERAARRDAEFASSAKSDFLAVMSHELRTPLNAIIGYVSLLADGITGPLNDQQVAQLGRVKGSATHLLALIEQILGLSRIEAGHEDMCVEQVDARAVVRDTTTLVEPLMAAKGLALHVDVPPEPSELATDVTKVRQILLNLLTNAGKFTDRGSVRCQLRADGEAFVIDVNDGGARYYYAQSRFAIADKDFEAYLDLPFPQGLNFDPDPKKKAIAGPVEFEIENSIWHKIVATVRVLASSARIATRERVSPRAIRFL